MKAFAAIMAVLLGYAIFVQLNDPDPWIWVAAYGVTVALTLGFLLQKVPWFVYSLFSLLFLSVAIYLFFQIPNFGMDDEV
ncbi:MAG: hypothetical protein F6K07_32990, partial [Okeania sp. SIO1H5]|uniref:transmembrane 220 family protein n=1 Tax=Okeania sp. SIO1H5 TaxID=2607777 RepID=UPI0013BC5C94